MELITGENDRGRRLDRILRKALPGYPLALIHRLLRQGQVLVDGKPARAQDRLENGMTISIPSLKDSQKPVTAAPDKNAKTRRKPEKHAGKLPSSDWVNQLEIIWEGAGLLAVNKPAGIAVHGRGSLDTAVQSFLEGKLPESLSFKPGPLHRLDKPSSGIVVFPASLDGARLFTSLLRERKVRKTYLAIVEGTVEKEEIWEDELFRDREKKKTFVSKERCHTPALKNAVTKVTPVASKNGYSLIQAEIATGRTHQIRAQAAAHGFPLAGDLKYNGQRTINREQRIKSKGYQVEFFLHAWKVEFLEYLIEAPLPEAFREKAAELFGDIFIK